MGTAKNKILITIGVVGLCVGGLYTGFLIVDEIWYRMALRKVPAAFLADVKKITTTEMEVPKDWFAQKSVSSMTQSKCIVLEGKKIDIPSELITPCGLNNVCDFTQNLTIQSMKQNQFASAVEIFKKQDPAIVSEIESVATLSDYRLNYNHITDGGIILEVSKALSVVAMDNASQGNYDEALRDLSVGLQAARTYPFASILVRVKQVSALNTLVSTAEKITSSTSDKNVLRKYADGLKLRRQYFTALTTENCLLGDNAGTMFLMMHDGFPGNVPDKEFFDYYVNNTYQNSDYGKWLLSPTVSAKFPAKHIDMAKMRFNVGAAFSSNPSSQYRFGKRSEKVIIGSLIVPNSMKIGKNYNGVLEKYDELIANLEERIRMD